MLSISHLGYGYCYVAGAKNDGRWPHAYVEIEADNLPKFLGSVGDFIKRYSAKYPHIHRQLSNVVKICPKCSKSCAFSLSSCNNCSESLVNEPITRGDNSLTGFIYGIEVCANYNLGTSIRYQDLDFLVYDDIMQTTMIHLNAIPTFVYIPDFRFLLERPEIGLGIVKDLYRVGKFGAKKMLENEKFRDKFYSKNAINAMENNLDNWIDDHVFAGFNYPPSQCQLHLQFILPPYVPYHAVLLAEGKHGDLGRFFPYKYLVQILETAVRDSIVVKMNEIEKMNGIQLAEFLSVRYKADYFEIFRNCICENARVSDSCANWNSDDFDFLVVDKRTVVGRDSDKVIVEPVNLIKRDQQIIQSYGKHRDGVDSSTRLQFYSFAKEPGALPDWENYRN